MTIADNKQYCKSLVGKKCYEKEMPNRIGTLERIVFHNKDYTICWFDFDYGKGCYLVPMDTITIIEQEQLQFFKI